MNKSVMFVNIYACFEFTLFRYKLIHYFDILNLLCICYVKDVTFLLLGFKQVSDMY
jgi:hypothetical protein